MGLTHFVLAVVMASRSPNPSRAGRTPIPSPAASRAMALSRTPIADAPSILPLAISAFSVFVAAASVLFTYRVAAATLWQKSNEDELRDISTKLETLYGPLMQMLQADHLVAQDIRSRQPDSDYRLLRKLFDKDFLNSLTAGDRALVAQVCDYAESLELFIRDHMGMVEYELIPYFARASAHFRILRLAYQGRLGNDPAPFERYVYPEQFDGVLRLETERLNARRQYLRFHPSTAPPPLEPLKIPPNLALRDWPNPGGTRIMTIMRGTSNS